MVTTDLNMFMQQEDYMSIKEKQDIQMKGLIEKYKAEGISEAEATNKARFIIYKPDHLESEKYDSATMAGVRPSVTIFFDTEEEFNYMRKFFDINLYNQIKNPNKLLHILQYYEENKLKLEGKMVDEVPKVPEMQPDNLLKPEHIEKQEEIKIEEVK